MSFNQSNFSSTGSAFAPDAIEGSNNFPSIQSPFGVAGNLNHQNAYSNSSSFTGSFHQPRDNQPFAVPAVNISTHSSFRDPFSNAPQLTPSFSDPFASSSHQSNISGASTPLVGSAVAGPSDPFVPRPPGSYQNSSNPTTAHITFSNHPPRQSLNLRTEQGRTFHGDPFAQPSSQDNSNSEFHPNNTRAIQQGSFGAQTSAPVLGDPFASQQAFPHPFGQAGSYSAAHNPPNTVGASSNQASFHPSPPSRSSGMPPKGDPFAPSHSREAQPPRSQLFLRSVPPAFFDREVILNHFATASFPPLHVTNVSLRGSRYDKKSRRTAIISFGSEADATKGMTLTDFQGEKLSLSLFRTATERIVDRAGEPSKELLFSYVPAELFSKDAIQNLFNSICPNGVLNVSTREKPTPNGVKRTAVITFLNTESALTALKNLPSYNDTRLHVTFRQPPQHLSKKSVSMDISSPRANDLDPDSSDFKPSQLSDPFNPSESMSQTGDAGDGGMELHYDDDDEIRPASTSYDVDQNKSRIHDDASMKPKADYRISKQKLTKSEEYAEKQREIEDLRRRIKEKEDASRKIKERERGKVRESNQRQYLSATQQPSESEWRKNEKVHILDAVSLVGTCKTMCPEAELKERALQEDFSVFESTNDTLDPSKAVKKYRRSAALSEQPNPSDVRPPNVLLRTMEHLKQVCDSDTEFVQIHHFVRDRTRSLRQDFTLQGIKDDSCMKIHEESVRFHILSEYLLSGLSTEKFSSKQNREQLDKCLISLREMYDLRRDNKLPTSQSEPEMQAYYVLAHMSEPKKCVQLLSGFAPEVRRSKALQFAFKVVRAASRSFGNGATYFACVREAPFLTACLMHSRFTEVRVSTFLTMNSAYGMQQSLDSIALSTIAHRFGFESNEEALAFCRHLKLKTNPNGSLERSGDISNIQILLPSMPSSQEDIVHETYTKWKPERPDNLIGSKADGLSPSQILEGKGGVAWEGFLSNVFSSSPYSFPPRSKTLRKEVTQRLQLLKATSEPNNDGRLEINEWKPIANDIVPEVRAGNIGSSSDHSKFRNLNSEHTNSAKDGSLLNESDALKRETRKQDLSASQPMLPFPDNKTNAPVSLSLGAPASSATEILDEKESTLRENRIFDNTKGKSTDSFTRSWKPEVVRPDLSKSVFSEVPGCTPFSTFTPGASSSNDGPKRRDRTKRVRFSLSSEQSPHPTFPSHVQPQTSQLIDNNNQTSPQPETLLPGSSEALSSKNNDPQLLETKREISVTSNGVASPSFCFAQQPILPEQINSESAIMPNISHPSVPKAPNKLYDKKPDDPVEEESVESGGGAGAHSTGKEMGNSGSAKTLPLAEVSVDISVSKGTDDSNNSPQQDKSSEKVKDQKQENCSITRKKIEEFTNEISMFVDAVERTVVIMRNRKNMTEALYLAEYRECLQSLNSLKEITSLAEDGQERAFKSDCARNWIDEEITLTTRSLLVLPLRRASLLWDELTLYLVRSESQLRHVKLRLRQLESKQIAQKPILVPVRSMDKPKLLSEMGVELPTDFTPGARSPPRQLSELTDVALQMFESDVRCWQASLVNLSDQKEEAARWVQTRLCGWFNGCMTNPLKFLEVETGEITRHISIVSSGNGSENTVPETVNVVIASFDASCNNHGEVEKLRENLRGILTSLKQRASNVNNPTPVVIVVVKEESPDPAILFELGEDFVSQALEEGLGSIVKTIHLDRTTARNFTKINSFRDILLKSVKLVGKWELCKGLTLRETTALHELTKRGGKALKKMLVSVRPFDDVNAKNLETIAAINEAWARLGVEVATQACRWPVEVYPRSEQSEVSIAILEKLRFPLPHQIGASDTVSYIEQLRRNLRLENTEIAYDDLSVHPFWQFCLALNSIMNQFINRHLGDLSERKILLPLGVRSNEDIAQERRIEARFQTLDPRHMGIAKQNTGSRFLRKRLRPARDCDWTSLNIEDGETGRLVKRIRLPVPRLSWRPTTSSERLSEGGQGRQITDVGNMYPALHQMFDEMVREEEKYSKVLEQTFAELQARAIYINSKRETL